MSLRQLIRVLLKPEMPVALTEKQRVLDAQWTFINKQLCRFGLSVQTVNMRDSGKIVVKATTVPSKRVCDLRSELQEADFGAFDLVAGHICASLTKVNTLQVTLTLE